MQEFQAMLEKSLQPLHSKMDEMKNQIESTIAVIKNSEEAISIAKEAKEVANKNKEDIELKDIKIKAIEKNIKTNTKMIKDITNTLDDNIEVMEKKRDANIERMIEEKIENIMKALHVW